MRRKGLTLVELLIVVMIILLLASIAMFAMVAATETAREARTRSVVSRIHELLVPMWESYQTRRVPMSITDTSPNAAAAKRLNAIRELMRVEMPDRKSDVEDEYVVISNAYKNPLQEAYRRTVANRQIGAWSQAHQGSECLYMILSRIQDGDTNGLEFLRESEIADTDKDGMPEILDGWGTPIAFLRWAPGYVPSKGANTVLQSDETNADGSMKHPDPFDPMDVYSGTYYLFPLVFSAGPDRVFDVNIAPTVQYSTTTPPNNPYPAVTPMVGEPDTAGGLFKDNITNQMAES